MGTARRILSWAGTALLAVALTAAVAAACWYTWLMYLLSNQPALD